MIKEIVCAIDDALKWEPNNIFHSTSTKAYNHEPRTKGDFFTGFYTSTTSFYTDYKYTKLGKIMNGLPLLLELLIKVVYYLISWPLYAVVKIPWLIVKNLFFPQGWF